MTHYRPGQLGAPDASLESSRFRELSAPPRPYSERCRRAHCRRGRSSFDEFGEFLFVASDRLRSIHAVQSRHLASIRVADFVWLVDPEGYVGQSASMELGFAVACGTPILTASTPNDLTLRQYVRTVSDLQECIRTVREAPTSREQRPLLVDPMEGATQLHLAIDQLEKQLIAPPGHTDEEELIRTFRQAHSLLDLP
jgi:hypothetical protein